MPATIKILPQYVANQIAAGEVIGRPEAVVKELIENSIDAGASEIKLYVKDAGKTLIRVIDNGSGMSEDDAMLAFQRHATSKISTAEDLENILTLGFRGEALASISSVAQVELTTCTKDDDLGVLVRNHGGELIEHSKVKSEKGTSVAVKNLFYNTPARRHFLKSNQTEFRHIYDTFLRQAIANPGLSFTFVNDDEQIFELQAVDLQSRLTQIYGPELCESLVEADRSTELISLSGFISKPGFNKRTKQDQFLFLNGRYIINKALSYAVHLAYQDLIEKGDYPYFFLFIGLDVKKFDVNVHPSKLEVKFEDDKAVFGFVKKTISETLDKNDLVPAAGLGTAEGFAGKSRVGQRFPISRKDTGGEKSSGSFSFKKQGLSREIPGSSNIHELEALGLVLSETGAETGQEDQPLMSHRPAETTAGKGTIWQFQKKYILYQMENLLMIVDQHAAHERILYERALDSLNSSANLSQQLLMPITHELNPVDIEVMKSIVGELRALGFDIELLPGRKFRLKGIPSDVRQGNENTVIQELLDEFKENDVKLNLEKRDNLAKSYSCKHAIRTGDKLSPDEMLNLIDNLFSTKMPYVCPHGRPTIIKVSMDELDKMFARKGF